MKKIVPTNWNLNQNEQKIELKLQLCLILSTPHAKQKCLSTKYRLTAPTERCVGDKMKLIKSVVYIRRFVQLCCDDSLCTAQTHSNFSLERLLSVLFTKFISSFWSNIRMVVPPPFWSSETCFNGTFMRFYSRVGQSWARFYIGTYRVNSEDYLAKVTKIQLGQPCIYGNCPTWFFM